MARNEQPEKYGERGEKKVINLQEGCRPEEQKGHNASSQTSNRKPPQGGSGTAPPRNNNQGKK